MLLDPISQNKSKDRSHALQFQIPLIRTIYTQKTGKGTSLVIIITFSTPLPEGFDRFQQETGRYKIRSGRVCFLNRGGGRRHNQRTVASLITLILRSPVRLTAVWGWGGGRKGEPALNRVRSSRAKCKTDVCVR